MSIKKLAPALGLGVALSLAAGPSFSQDLWAFQDDDIDGLLDSSFNLKPVGVGNTIDVGDVLFTVFEIDTFTINGINAIPAGQELTGVTAVQVLTKDLDGNTIENDFGLGPVAGGLASVFTSILGFDPCAPNCGAGSMLAMWFNGAPGGAGDIALNLDAAQLGGATNCISLVDCTTQATLGSLLQVDGFLGDPDEFWRADLLPLPPGFSGDEIDDVASLGIGTTVAVVNFGLSNIFNTVTPVLFQDILQDVCVGAALGDADGCVSLRGSANIIGGTGLANGFFAHSDVDATKYVGVPEPGSLALFSLGLLALGVRSFPRLKA